jgi:hypothetical protein
VNLSNNVWWHYIFGRITAAQRCDCDGSADILWLPTFAAQQVMQQFRALLKLGLVCELASG